MQLLRRVPEAAWVSVAQVSQPFAQKLKGLVQQMQRELAQKSQHDSTIYLTGGSAKYWCEDFPNWRFQPYLLLSGLAQSKVWSEELSKVGDFHRQDNTPNFIG